MPSVADRRSLPVCVLLSSAALGQPAGMTDTNGLTTENTYDLRGLVIQTRAQELRDGQLVWVVTRTTYDAAARPLDDP